VSSLVLLLAAVLLAGVLGFVNWQVGVAERDALAQRTVLDVVEARAGRWSTRLETRFQRTGPGRRLRRRIERAGLGWRTLDVALVLAAIGLVTFAVAQRFMSWWFALALALVLARLSLGYLDRREAQRREAFVAQLPEVARVLSNATSAGLALRSAIRMASDDVADPAGGELRRLSEELSVGTPIADALGNLHDRLPSRELSLLTRTLIIQARAGGAVVSALRQMSETLEARKDLRREIRTMLSGAVYTSWLVLFLGAGSLVMINLVAPGTLDKVTSSVVGQIALLVAAGMFSLGYVMIRRTTRIGV
jgi:tight adherence protein B